jgi:hypothetical protein
MSPRLRLPLTAAGVAAAAVLAAPAVARAPFPETVPVPTAFEPEGIDKLRGTTVVVGSIPTGDLYAADVRTGRGTLLSEGGPGDAAIGVEVQGRRILVAGGPTGKLRVVDARTGAELFETVAGDASQPGATTFVNDVAVLGGKAYFTDSRAPRIYELSLTDYAVRTIPLSGDYESLPGPDAFNLNGIDATRDGSLIAVQTGAKKLLRIDPATGAATEVDLGGYDLANGDGLFVEGNLLSVVQNRSNQIAQFRLSPDATSARLLRVLRDPDFNVPTTVTRVAGRLYAINAEFGTPPAGNDYAAVRVDGSQGKRAGRVARKERRR